MNKVNFTKFFDIIKGKTFGFKGGPLNFNYDIFIDASAEFEDSKDPAIVVTNIKSGFCMAYRESTSEITFDPKKDEYTLKTPERKLIFKIY